MKLSEATISIIKQNLFLAFAYNRFGVPIAAGILYPITGMVLSPMIAAAAMSLSLLSVISNALRLRSLKLDDLYVKLFSLNLDQTMECSVMLSSNDR